MFVRYLSSQALACWEAPAFQEVVKHLPDDVK